MCGIAGVFSQPTFAVRRTMQQMCDLLVHRGPDDVGMIYVDPTSAGVRTDLPDSGSGLVLGHRRLSILDITAAGHQPMVGPGGRSWIVYNGEVYNFLELRDELAGAGYSFRSDSDTEVILAAYDHWGRDCLQRFNGMWAFALWDAVSGELFCARDRLGVKPFYYVAGGGRFVFASEIKALFACEGVARAPNPAIIHDYLSLKLSDHTDETFFAGIRALPPAHWLVFRPGQPPQIERFWDAAVSDELDASDQDRKAATDELRALLTQSVRLRLRSDVPVGTCLSGGLDSSTIALLVNELMQSEHGVSRSNLAAHQKTFSACFDDPRFDERRFIDEVLDATGADTRRIFPDGALLWEELSKVLWHMDEPFHSTSQYSQYNVMRCVAEGGVKVTLDGQGADELMAGYPGYYGVLLTSLARRGELGLLHREARAAAALGGRGRGWFDIALKLGYGVLPFELKRHIREALAGSPLAGRTPEGRSMAMLRPEFRAQHADRMRNWLTLQDRLMGSLSRRLYADTFQFSLPSLLRYEDRNSMAFSIEARTPFLDYRVVEHVMSTPALLKIRDGWSKWMLREAMRDVLPESIRSRKDKMGFVTPEAVWLDAGREQVREVFAGSLKSEPYLEGDAIRARLDGLLDATSSVARYTDIFRWLTLELWLRSFDA
jgi:asparagine synthase (glutamine-hydrolysing)